VKADPVTLSRSGNAILNLVEIGRSGPSLITAHNHAAVVSRNGTDPAKEAMIVKEIQWKAIPAMRTLVQSGLLIQIGRLAQLVAAKGLKQSNELAKMEMTVLEKAQFLPIAIWEVAEAGRTILRRESAQNHAEEETRSKNEFVSAAMTVLEATK